VSIAAIGLQQVLDDVTRLEHASGALVGVAINQVGDHHPSALLYETFPAWTSLGHIVQHVGDLQFGQYFPHQAAVRRGFIVPKLDRRGIQFNILDSLLSSDATEATDEGSEEAAQSNEGHTQDQRNVSIAVGHEEVGNDVSGAIDLAIAVVVDEERELLFSAHSYGFSTELLASFRARQYDAIQIEHAEGFPHETAVRITLKFVKLEDLVGSGPEGSPH